MITTTTIFDHKNTSNKQAKERPIEVRVTIDRQAYYINTGIKVLKSQWKNNMIVNRTDAHELNERLKVIVRKIEKEITRRINKDLPMDVAEIRRVAYGAPTSDNDAMLWLEEEISNLNVTEGVRKHYATLLKRLKAFGQFTSWGTVTVENIYKFDAWLHRLPASQSDAKTKMGESPTLITDAAVWNYHKNFKALLYRAEKMGVIDHNPYNRLRGAFRRSSKETIDYLTDDEMEAIVNLPVKEGTQVAVARDLFVIQMYTGLSYSDMQAFNINDYARVGDTYINTGTRIKTGVPYISHLLPPVLEILEKYHFQVPKINNSDYNAALKAIGMVIGIEKPLHSHMARHTFATWMLRNGVKIENLSKMLGHTNITQTQRYARVLAASVHDEFEKIEKKVFRK